jgi:peptide-methionine (S)-S-oxide reductase
MWGSHKSTMPTKESALPGRTERMPVPAKHHVNAHTLTPPFAAGLETAMFGLGCFWGAEKAFWLTPGVYTTAVGYAGGFTPNPTYEEVCTGRTGHNEVVLVVFDPKVVSYEGLLKVFWEGHDPTQGMRQGSSSWSQSAIANMPTNRLTAAVNPHSSTAARMTSVSEPPRKWWLSWSSSVRSDAKL